MGFGFRGQSDNKTIIDGASLSNNGEVLSPNLKAEIKQILSNEIKARKIEYATLVGKDLKIIVNANNDRTGEVFNPDNLVSEVLNYPRQVKATGMVKWSELKREAPPLPERAKNQDALIRYTVTPIKDPNTQTVIGVLVSGDIVNGKDTIIRGTLKATSGGYGAIYLHKPSGEFALVSALEQNKSEDVIPASGDIAASSEGKLLLASVMKSEGKPVSARLQIGNQMYAVAAKIVPNKVIDTTDDDKEITVLDEQAVAILVRGNPETALNKLLEKSFWIELLALSIALGIILFWAYILRQSIIRPIQNLRQTAQRFAKGDTSARAEIFAIDEIGQLGASFNSMADSITSQKNTQDSQLQLRQLVNEITARCRNSLNTQYILNSAVNSIYEAIKADRVLVYSFDENWQGQIVAEAVGVDFPVALGVKIADPCFEKSYVEKYQKGRILALEDIEKANLTECHLNQLRPLAVKASLVAPILIDNKLYGLLIAHQCSAPRVWQDLEISLFKQVAIPIGYALEQASMLEQIEKASSQVEIASQEDSVLRQQIQQLVTDITELSQGDLTVRSEIISGKIGTVAEFINKTIAGLQGIAAKIQADATEVNTAIAQNYQIINQLAGNNPLQTIAINQTIRHLSEMTLTLQALAENSEKIVSATHDTTSTVRASKNTIELTVENIDKWRSNIEETEKKFKRLGNYSQTLSSIVARMNLIAIQGNLLVVNTGLEVENYNEGNEDFSSVIENFNELVTGYTDTTREIEKLVDDIQQETKEIVQAIDIGKLQATEGSRSLKIVQNNLQIILQVSSQVDKLAQAIAQTTGYQIQTSEEFTSSLQGIMEDSKATYNLFSEIVRVQEKTQQLSQELQASVGNFKTS
ncbi:MAG: HAMP domain-containing protein [Scytonematopsis contorta HA4267-MV1]|nr:HAMP domain-containing protein [Scytonematopsis contorta HA4267-MV1]